MSKSVRPAESLLRGATRPRGAGNTLLCISSQNLNPKMCEMLINRNADINHRNSQGNTPLHFAMAYDSEGTLAEYLIQQGADDTIENQLGCTCYDGIGQ